MRLIDADALSTKVIFVCEDGYDGADMVLKKDIDNAPTIEAEPVRHGQKAKSAISNTGLMCTACYSDIDSDAVFCKYCGAKMDGGAEE